MRRSIVWAALAALLLAACAQAAPTASPGTTLPTVTVYRSPT